MPQLFDNYQLIILNNTPYGMLAGILANMPCPLSTGFTHRFWSLEQKGMPSNRTNHIPGQFGDTSLDCAIIGLIHLTGMAYGW